MDFEQTDETFFIPDGSKKSSVQVPRRLLELLVQGAHPSEAVHISVLILPFLADWITLT